MIETDDVARLKALIVAQQEEITALKAVIADLNARLSQNSANSHKPPSSDGLAKKPLIKPALPKQVGKKPGRQPGHPGKTLLFVEQPDLIHTPPSYSMPAVRLTPSGARPDSSPTTGV